MNHTIRILGILRKPLVGIGVAAEDIFHLLRLDGFFKMQNAIFKTPAVFYPRGIPTMPSDNRDRTV
ncbi:MAG: hypothetical protein BBJ57_11680 [Desulfobacterales bacterium PC51MH44]|nr:MAG: hypothetical protein BBJ57_11680 [Desulfobacterales bacterium PC51MH44]